MRCRVCRLTSRHLHQRIDEHRFSAIGKHLKNDHGIKTIGDLNSNFRPQEMRQQTGLFNLRNVVYEEEETKTEHVIELYSSLRRRRNLTL